MEKIEKKRWQRALESIYVCLNDNVKFDLIISEKEKVEGVFICLDSQKNYKELGVDLRAEENKMTGRVKYVKYIGYVKDALDIGYYNLKVKTDKNEYQTILAVAPKQCYQLNKKNKEKMFGYAVQLYSLKSKRNWGVGDFTDLSSLVDLAAQSGGDVIGLNPLNVLHHDYPRAASPYSSISRLFLNPIYIDVEKVPSYKKSDKDEKAVLKAREAECIDYATVYGAKIRALKAIFERVMADKNSSYMKEFEAFKEEEGADLQRLAVFQAISHERFLKGGKLSTIEEKNLCSANSSGVEKFYKAHLKEVEFFEFLQFEANRQLQAVHKKIKKSGLKVGLYRDLPVGVAKSSAEVWGDSSLYLQSSGAGAPPDSYFPTGQKWNLGAFNPFELKERAYKPFIKILRANMRYAGAIRIDHVMGLSRLFVIPDDGEDGAYIRYDARDMANILALESHLNQCAVVGECIGNVEEGYTKSLLDKGLYLLGVLWCERKDENGTMKAPHEYEEKYFSSVGTHDMPPLKAWWFGREIDVMHKLGLYSEEEMRSAYRWREHERRLLLEALDREGVWPQDNLRKGSYLYGEGFPEGMDEAVHAYMAKTKSDVFLLMLEDIFQSERIQNLPGTDVEQYPNWCAKQVVDLEDMKDSEMYQRHMHIVKQYR